MENLENDISLVQKSSDDQETSTINDVASTSEPPVQQSNENLETSTVNDIFPSNDPIETINEDVPKSTEDQETSIINDVVSTSESLVLQSSENLETSTANDIFLSNYPIETINEDVPILTVNQTLAVERSIDHEISSSECPVEKSIANPEILSFLLGKPETEHCLYKPYNLVDVAENSDEFVSVADHFRARDNENMNGRYATVDRIRRIECPCLSGLFLMKREKLEEKLPNARVMTLYHGTRKGAINGICKLNFNWRRIKSYIYGQGVSFARHVSYARYYTPDNVIIRSQVLVGRDTVGSSDTKIPPESYDTTTNGKGTVYVKYEDDDFYPEYIINFS